MTDSQFNRVCVDCKEEKHWRKMINRTEKVRNADSLSASICHDCWRIRLSKEYRVTPNDRSIRKLNRLHGRTV